MRIREKWTRVLNAELQIPSAEKLMEAGYRLTGQTYPVGKGLVFTEARFNHVRVRKEVPETKRKRG